MIKAIAVALDWFIKKIQAKINANEPLKRGGGNGRRRSIAQLKFNISLCQI